MKILRTIMGHLGLATALGGARLRQMTQHALERMAGMPARAVRRVPLGSSS
jgi:hypothetical protein